MLIEAVVVGEVIYLFTLGANVLEGRGSRGRGRGETRGRGRGAAPGSTDAVSTAATIASDETPMAWPDATSADDTTVADTESKDINGVDGKPHEETTPVQISVWGNETKTPAIEAQPSPVNGTTAKKLPTSSTPTSRQSRIVDPTAKFSWASIVKPVAPPPAPKPSALSKKEYAVALYDYTAQAEGDLTFHAGDRIEIVKKGDDANEWWIGKFNGAEGQFPANYTRLESGAK